MSPWNCAVTDFAHSASAAAVHSVVRLTKAVKFYARSFSLRLCLSVRVRPSARSLIVRQRCRMTGSKRKHKRARGRAGPCLGGSGRRPSSRPAVAPACGTESVRLTAKQSRAMSELAITSRYAPCITRSRRFPL